MFEYSILLFLTFQTPGVAHRVRQFVRSTITCQTASHPTPLHFICHCFDVNIRLRISFSELTLNRFLSSISSFFSALSMFVNEVVVSVWISFFWFFQEFLFFWFAPQRYSGTRRSQHHDGQRAWFFFDDCFFLLSLCRKMNEGGTRYTESIPLAPNSKVVWWGVPSRACCVQSPLMHEQNVLSCTEWERSKSWSCKGKWSEGTVRLPRPPLDDPGLNIYDSGAGWDFCIFKNSNKERRYCGRWSGCATALTD